MAQVPQRNGCRAPHPNFYFSPAMARVKESAIMASGAVATRSGITGRVNWWDGTPVPLARLIAQNHLGRPPWLLPFSLARSVAEAAQDWRCKVIREVRTPPCVASFGDITPTRLSIPNKPCWNLILAPVDWAYHMPFLEYAMNDSNATVSYTHLRAHET